MRITKQSLGLCAGLLIMVAPMSAMSDATSEANVAEVEPNDIGVIDPLVFSDNISFAQDIDGQFTLGPNPFVENSDPLGDADPNNNEQDPWPWVSVSGTGDGTFDFYKFYVTVPTGGAVQGIIEIDDGWDDTNEGSIDTELIVFENGSFLAQGTVSALDQRLELLFDEPGVNEIVVLVGESQTRYISFLDRFADDPNPPDAGDTYVLQVSLSEHEVGGTGDDADEDGIPDAEDNCPNTPNPDQADSDGDGIGDACDEFNDVDQDGDGILDADDNCVVDFNPGQEDLDGDGIGDACDDVNDLDLDGDGVEDDVDNCPSTPNPGQEDLDGDGIGDACDDFTDQDDDGVEDAADNCPTDANADQADLDGDGNGDACDDDIDGDGVANGADECESLVGDTVVVEYCDTGVADSVFENGCSIQDAVLDCAADARNHGKFVSCVSKLTNGLKKNGVIYGSDKGAIMNCAGQSFIGQ